MTVAHDRKFTDIFTLVVGILAGIAIGIYFLASYVGGQTQEAQVRNDGEYLRQVAARIAPAGKVAVSGQDNTALEPPQTASASAAPAVSTTVLAGDEVYQMACVLCHGAGVAGAPKYGDKEAWAPRLAKGIEVLHQNALKGVQSATGVMPAKGGRADLADASIINGVDYLLAGSN